MEGGDSIESEEMKVALIDKRQGQVVECRCGGGVVMEEIRKQWWIAGPMVAVNLLQYSLQVISVMMVGHLGELPLSSASIATSFAGVSGFSLLLLLFSPISAAVIYGMALVLWCSHPFGQALLLNSMACQRWTTVSIVAAGDEQSSMAPKKARKVVLKAYH